MRTYHDGAELAAMTGAGPDGELIWTTAGIAAPPQFCAMYRGFFVFEQQAGAWKIVHQHYSSPFF